MDDALHVIKVSKYDGFEVRTCLFSDFMETRVFPNDHFIPDNIIKNIRGLEYLSSFGEEIFVAAESDEGTTDYTGVSVTSVTFPDANQVHGRVGKIVEDFLNAHDRVVTYVPK